MQVGIKTLAYGLDTSTPKRSSGLQQDAERRLRAFNERGVLRR